MRMCFRHLAYNGEAWWLAQWFVLGRRQYRFLVVHCFELVCKGKKLSRHKRCSEAEKGNKNAANARRHQQTNLEG